jgi:hypothetical protein
MWARRLCMSLIWATITPLSIPGRHYRLVKAQRFHILFHTRFPLRCAERNRCAFLTLRLRRGSLPSRNLLQLAELSAYGFSVLISKAHDDSQFRQGITIANPSSARRRHARREARLVGKLPAVIRSPRASRAPAAATSGRSRCA